MRYSSCVWRQTCRGLIRGIGIQNMRQLLKELQSVFCCLLCFIFQRDPYSGNAFLPGESSSDEETPLMELSKEELCNKIESLKEKLRSIRKENSRLRQSLVMLQGKTSKGLAFQIKGTKCLKYGTTADQQLKMEKKISSQESSKLHFRNQWIAKFKYGHIRLLQR